MKKRGILIAIILITSIVVFAGMPSEAYLNAKKRKMLNLFKSIGLNKPDMLKAFRELDRTKFAFNRQRRQQTNAWKAYADYPLPIGYGQTISSPRMMAIMSHYLDVTPNHKILEIGTGSGYQGAILSKMVKEVYSIEIVPQLGKIATKIYREQGLTNIKNKIGDGYFGWQEHAPFDRIIVTCATNHVPPALLRQLKRGGILVIPVGHPYRKQMLKIIKKDMNGRIRTKNLLKVKFVPMTGRALRGIR